MLVELLQPAGADLVRRLAAALMLVPREEREAVVSAIERRVVETYGVGEIKTPTNNPTLIHVSPPEQRPGYVEQIEIDYERPPHVPRVDQRTRASHAVGTARKRAR